MVESRSAQATPPLPPPPPPISLSQRHNEVGVQDRGGTLVDYVLQQEEEWVQRAEGGNMRREVCT